MVVLHTIIHSNDGIFHDKPSIFGYAHGHGNLHMPKGTGENRDRPCRYRWDEYAMKEPKAGPGASEKVDGHLAVAAAESLWPPINI